MLREGTGKPRASTSHKTQSSGDKSQTGEGSASRKSIYLIAQEGGRKTNKRRKQRRKSVGKRKRMCRTNHRGNDLGESGYRSRGILRDESRGAYSRAADEGRGKKVQSLRRSLTSRRKKISDSGEGICTGGQPPRNGQQGLSKRQGHGRVLERGKKADKDKRNVYGQVELITLKARKEQESQVHVDRKEEATVAGCRR